MVYPTVIFCLISSASLSCVYPAGEPNRDRKYFERFRRKQHAATEWSFHWGTEIHGPDG